MQAVILAAGSGSRLGHLTRHVSKAMVPILGKPITERVLDRLVANGVNQFVLVVSPGDDAIRDHFHHRSQIAADLRFVCQPKPLGMADALRYAAPLIDGAFLLSACDNLIPREDVGRLITHWRAAPELDGLLTVMRVEPERLQGAAVVEMEGTWVTRIVEKPMGEDLSARTASLPLYCFSSRILDCLPRVSISPRGEYELQDAIQMLIEQAGRVGAMMVERRQTLTHPSDLLVIAHHYLTQRGGYRPRVAAEAVGRGTRLVPPLNIEPGTVIGAACEIGPYVAIERDCHIGDRVAIRNAVLLPGTAVPDGKTVADRCIQWPPDVPSAAD